MCEFCNVEGATAPSPRMERIMKGVIFFTDSDSLRSYVCEHDVYVRNGCWSIGTLEFIDADDLHVVFMNRSAYENWDNAGRPIQISLF